MATRQLRRETARQQGLFQPVPTGPRWEALPEDLRALVTTLLSRILHAYRARTAQGDGSEAHHD